MIGFGATGFGRTPVSKAFLVLTIASSLLFGIANKKVLLSSNVRLWHMPIMVFSFTSMLELLFGALILYSFRHFERIFGSRKFASIILFLSTATMMLQLLSWQFYSIRDVIMPGPYSIIFCLYVYFFSIIPSVSSFKILGIQFGEKLIMYALGAQLAMSNLPGSLLASLFGIALGLLHSASFLPFQKILIPEPAASVCGRVFGPLLMTNSNESHRGQRLSPNNLSMQDQRATLAPPNENDVTVLVGMGFSEDAVRRALAETHNDVHLATEILLQGSS